MLQEKDVQKANKEFYDIAADIYEVADGRRKDFPLWLEDILKKLAERTDGKVLIDLGSGSGWVANIASKYFKTVIAVDISYKILNTIKSDLYKLNCILENLPVKNESCDAITCFAVLHHICYLKPVLFEAFRVLKKNGIFYSDHDITEEFVQKFYLPMKIYRKINSAERRYFRMDKRLTSELYKKSEIHENGISSKEVMSLVKEAGFNDISISHHWLGLNRLTDVMFGFLGHKGTACGWAPIMSIKAIKQEI